MKEGNQIDYKLLDSSIWIAYLFESACKNLIEGEDHLFISVLSLYEIKKFLLKQNVEKEIINEKISFVKKRCTIINLVDWIAEMASRINVEEGVPAIDALIYSSARFKNLVLVTMDNDFRGLERVEILSKKV